MPDRATVTVFLFTDIEGSTRLWEQAPDRMRDALVRHDVLAAQSVEAHHGRVVKSTGDGIHAVFHDPLDAVRAALALQLALANPAATAGIALKVRCGLHAGVDSRRDDDFYGNAVNRAARVMSIAHGGQILLSQAVATLVSDRLPDDVALRALGAVRLRDLTQPEHVFQLTHPELRQQFPALRSLEATPNNLPQQLTSFIGREHEVAEVRRQLRHARLLTILGIGGLGKSRLSLEVASEALDDYPDGAWFVELAAVADARLVPQVVASVLGVKEESGHVVQDTLRKFVRDRRLLLVLDNCEHLTQACAELARKLLESGPQITVLATSRERLGVAGERTFPLAPFAVPLPRQHLAPEALAQFASVRLFAERAAAVRADFAITAGNAPAVAEICHRLDGIPLALELAAARVRAMSVEKIAERLSDRFKLLSGGDRTALPRQQTLRALIDWSYDLLTDAERTVLARLSVFAGGFTLEAAEKVAAGGAIAEGDVLEQLTQLVEKSLVTLDAERERYGMLETVRQYAHERLRTAGREKAVLERHLAYYLAFAESARTMLLGPYQASWLRKLDVERENLLAAHACCDGIRAGGEQGLQLARAIRNYCFIRGLLEFGLRITSEALERPRARNRDFARCRALSDAGQFAASMGRHDEALRYLQESLSIAHELDDKVRVEAVLQPLARAYLGKGELPTARVRLEEALVLAREIDNPREVMAALSMLAQIHRIEGKFEAAIPLCLDVLAIGRRIDDRESTAVGLINLAMAEIETGERQAACSRLREAQSIVADSGLHGIGQALLEAAAGLAVHGGDALRAARFLGVTQSQTELSGLQRDRADEAFLASCTDKIRETLGESALREAQEAGRALAYDAAIDELRGWLADFR